MSEGLVILLIAIGGGCVFGLIYGMSPQKKQTGNFSSVSPGYGPEYRDDRENRYILRQCQRWPRMREIRAVAQQEHVSLFDAAVQVCAKHGEALPPRLAEMAQSRSWVGVRGDHDTWTGQPDQVDYRDIQPINDGTATQQVTGITQKSDRYGFPVEGWPEARPTPVELPAKVRR